MADKADSGDSLTIQFTKVNGHRSDRAKIAPSFSGFSCFAVCLFTLFTGLFATAQETNSNTPDLPIFETAMRVMTLIHSPEIEWPSGDTSGEPTAEAAPATKDSFVAMLADSPDPRSRIAWLEGAFRSGDQDHIRLAVSTLADRDERVRSSAASALRPCPPDALADVLIDWAIETAPSVRSSADDVLPNLRESLGPILLAKLQDDMVSVDRMAASAYLLGRMGAREAADDLRNRAWTRNRSIAIASADALARIATEADLDALQELATHPEADIRAIVVDGAANVGGEKGVDLLHAIAMQPREPQLAVLHAAVAALGASNHPRGIHALIDILQKRSNVRPETIAALQRLTGLPLDPLPVYWFAFYDQWVQNEIWPIPGKTVSAFDPEFVQGNFSAGP